jgi:hypothetical protein
VPWATEADALKYTGKAVAEDELIRAQATIELHVGRIEDLATVELSARDLEWLKRAVSYQAAWEPGQPDLHTRTEVTRLSQDGISAEMPATALTLAPLAKRAIRKLSWMGNRSTCVAPFRPEVLLRYPVGGPITDYPFEPWKPL